MCNRWQNRGDLSKFLSTGAVGITGTKLGRLCWVALAVCVSLGWANADEFSHRLGMPEWRRLWGLEFEEI